MEIMLSLKRLVCRQAQTDMTVRKLLFLLLLVSPLLTTAQKKIASVDVRNVACAYVDRPGDLYILHTDGHISKFDTLGKPVENLTFEQAPTLFEPRDGARMFVYVEGDRLARFFSPETKQEISIQDHFAVEPIFAASSGDNLIWIVDKADWSIKRLDPRNPKMIAEALIDRTQFKGDPQIVTIREYQNFLFVLESNTGILVFNGIGKQIKKIAAPGITYFNFLGRELYYKKDDNLIFYDLFDGSTREEAVDKESRYTLLTDTRKYVVYANRIEVLGH